MSLLIFPDFTYHNIKKKGKRIINIKFAKGGRSASKITKMEKISYPSSLETLNLANPHLTLQSETQPILKPSALDIDSDEILSRYPVNPYGTCLVRT